AGGGVAGFEAAFVVVGQEAVGDRLEGDEQEEERDRELDDRDHLRASNAFAAVTPGSGGMLRESSSRASCSAPAASRAAISRARRMRPRTSSSSPVRCSLGVSPKASAPPMRLLNARR